MKVSYHATILNVSAGLYLGATGLYGLFHDLITVAGLLAVGAIALVADLSIQRSVRNRQRQNRMGLCIALLIAIGLLTLK